jgi:predicted nucleic acid-binding protein
MSVAVDTSALYALMDRRDRWHNSASEYYASICEEQELVITDHILVECWFLVRSHLGAKIAMTFSDWTIEGPITVLGVSFEIIENARNIAHTYLDSGFSFVDCTTMATMVDLGLSNVFTFDHHFDLYRYGAENQFRFSRVPQS